MRILILLLLAGSVSAAETVIHNISGYTSTAAGTREFSVLVVSDTGRVVATGGESLLNEHSDAIRIDGDGRTLLPGLIDAHAHMQSLGALRANLDLTGTPSLDAAVAQIDAYAKQNPHAARILGRGWNQVLWPVKEFPTAADIDAVVDDRPVFLNRIDGHAGWANTAAMKLAGIDRDTPDPQGGKIIRDNNGNATGVLIDTAMAFVEDRIPKPNKDDIRGAYRTAIGELVSLGITSVHDAGVNTAESEVYLSMAEDGELDLRVYAMVGGAGEDLDAIGQPIRGAGNDRLDIAAVKLFADGALGSRGAAMLEPYSDDPENKGLIFWSDEELLAQAQKAFDMGFQVCIHAIGDHGNRAVLDTFEKIQGGKPSNRRNRVEHSQIIALDDIPRFAELGVIASMQATHATSDMNMAEDRVGPERIKGGYAWRRLLESGAIIANGSDFPVELVNPFYGLHAAVTRQDRGNLPEGGWYIDQGMTREEALHSFTLAAAYAAHQEDRLGSLEPGKWADFIIVDRDYFEIPASEIHDIRVLETWVGGERIYTADD
jgi:predicted amidohydrolase YtcJ